MDVNKIQKTQCGKKKKWKRIKRLLYINIIKKKNSNLKTNIQNDF